MRLAPSGRIPRLRGGTDRQPARRFVRLAGENVTAIEMKLHDWAEALHQAVAYQLAADWTWVVMPLAAASRAYRERWRFEAERVGLLAVDDRGKVRTPISAGRTPRLLPFVQDKILATWREPKVGDD